MAKIFLEAEWRKLIMANYEIDPSILKPYLPNKTELDLFNGVCYVSLIGFLFSNTRMLGVKVPLQLRQSHWFFVFKYQNVRRESAIAH